MTPTLSSASDTIALGRPRWSGGYANWLQAIERLGPQQAAAQADGPFAVGLTLPDGRIFLAVDRFAQETLFLHPMTSPRTVYESVHREAARRGNAVKMSAAHLQAVDQSLDAPC